LYRQKKKNVSTQSPEFVTNNYYGRIIKMINSVFFRSFFTLLATFLLFSSTANAAHCDPVFTNDIGPGLDPGGTGVYAGNCAGTVGCSDYFDLSLKAGDSVFLSTCPDDGGSYSFDTGISVWSGGLFDTLESCVDDSCGVGTRSDWIAPADGTYRFRVGGFGGGNGVYDLVHDFETEDFSKEITAGNDVDEAGGIDLAVEVGIETPAAYDFIINYDQPNLPPVQIEDTVPAEWRVSGLENDSLNCEVVQANKGRKDDSSATKLVCLPGGTEGTVTVLADARCHNKRNNNKCKPTSCGALYLNNGAAAYELDPDTGEPVVDENGDRLPPLVETNSLCLVAVSDLNGGGIDYSGNGDEDGDGLLDRNEACDVGTDPCVGDSDGDGVSDFDEVASGCMDPLNPDTDGDTISDGNELTNGTDPCEEDSDNDGVRDDVDNCPLEGPADPLLGEILNEDGCLRQSQCSDGLDNEPDGNTDFPADASCDDILDDSEDSIDPATGNVTFRDGYYWVKADYPAPRSEHGNVCASEGLVATTAEVALTWDATLLSDLSSDFGYSSNGDDGCCAESMWCWDGDGGPNTPAGMCETHYFTNRYFNYGTYSGDPDERPVFTCSDP
jgi:hypothetical protein